MKTRKYIKASVDDKEWNIGDFKTMFTFRKDNGMDDFRPMIRHFQIDFKAAIAGQFEGHHLKSY